MTVPVRLGDRLLVVTREDYVRMLDDDPLPLRDDRVTVVPVPLVGGWMELPELDGVDLSPGAVLVRDPQDPGSYVPVPHAARSASRAKCHLLLKVCQLLGATAVSCDDLSSYRGGTGATNTFTASGRAGYDVAGRGKRAEPQERAGTDRNLTATLDHEVRDELRFAITTSGSWRGGEPDIEGAAAQLDEHRGTVDHDLRALIDMRRARGNPMRSYTVSVDLFSDLHRSLSVIGEFTSTVEAALGRDRVRASTVLRNAFEWKRAAEERATFRIEVTFPDAARA